MEQLARVRTSTVFGVDAIPVDVEVQVKAGTPCFTIIGLGDSAVRESRDRVLAAIRYSGFRVPDRILVNLAPAEIRKEGSAFDVPIALSILAASGQLKMNSLKGRAFCGELALDGTIKPVRGVLAFAVEALADGAKEILVPVSNLAEARLISELSTLGVSHLAETVGYLNDGQPIISPPHQGPRHEASVPSLNFSDVWGQASAKRALIIAAAGAHNLLLIGPPGCGKSMLAERLPSILPPLSRDEALEVVRIHSIAGLPIQRALLGERPFRTPHHVVSDIGLIGGGSYPRPGEISLAHHGVLFLDEFPEYRRSALEALRAPMESGQVRIARSKASLVFPARFQLIAAMNPCPCGRLGHGNCACSRQEIANYLKRLSQPILDRIDLHVDLNPVPVECMAFKPTQSDTSEVADPRDQIRLARARQYERRKLNSSLSGEEIGQIFELDAAALQLLEKAAKKVGLSARGYVRVLRVAATIADLGAQTKIGLPEVAEAIGFRSLDRLKNLCNL